MNQSEPSKLIAEKTDLLDWTETFLCNAVPMSRCTQEDWDAKMKKRRDKKQGVTNMFNASCEEEPPI